MGHRSTLLLLVVSLFAASQSASLYPTESGPLSSENVCAQTCNLINNQVAYQPGKTYVYNVDLETRIGDQTEDDQQIKISAIADISAYSQCELVLKLRKVHAAGAHNHHHLALKLEKVPIHFAYEDGKIVSICADEEDEKWVVDIKKSIISSLQMSSSDVSKKQTLIETDISGQCETVYQPLQHDSDITIIRKTKQMNRCGQRHQFNTAFFPRSYGLDQALSSSLSFITSNSTSECTQVLKNQIVESVTCEDHQQIRHLGIQVFSRIEVQLIEKKPTLAVQRIERKFRPYRLTMSADEMTFQSHHRRDGRTYTVNDVQQLLKHICGRVQNSVQLDVPELFYQLIQSVHSLSALEQAQLWEQIRSHELCSTEKLIDIFLDASALAGNEGSAEVLIRAYQQQQISQQRANYLFGLLAFAKHPTVEAAQRLVAFVQQPQQLVNVPRGVIFGITGFVHNLQIVQQQSHRQDSNVDQVVQTIVQTLVSSIQQVVPQVQNQQQQQQALTLVYALRNLILVQGTTQQQEVLQIAQQLVAILRQVTVSQYNQEIRVAIVKTLVNAGIDDNIRQFLIEHLVQNQQEGIEIQIESYKAVVLSGATQAQLEQIKQYTDQVFGQPRQQELVNYIRSHQANLRSTSDPHKQTILPINAPVFDKPSGQWFGISRNYELSYVNEALNLGVTAETDVIYAAVASSNQFAPVPQTVSFNLTIPIGGQELQLVEVRLHQHGLEPVIARHLARMERSKWSNDPWKVAKETVQYILQNGAEILADNQQVHVLIQIVVDGKTLVLIDEQDFLTGQIQEQSFVQELMHSLNKQISVDRAFAITPIDTVIQYPSVNGLPVHIRVNSTFVLGLKTDLTFDLRDKANSVIQLAVYPSLASQMETAVEFQAGPEHKSIEYVQNVYSAPQVNLRAEVTKGRLISFKVNLPEEKYTLARFESLVYTRNVQGQRVRMANSKAIATQNQRYPNVHVCTQNTHNALGVVLCYDFTYSTPHNHGIDVIAEITVVKTDSTMRSYEMTLESPHSIEQIFAPRRQAQLLEQVSPFKFVFNTPGSQIDREIVLEVELPNSNSDHIKEARLRIQSPWKRVVAQASLRNEAKERIANVEVSVDDQKMVVAELALETIRRGQKTEYRPRLKLAMDSILESPVHLAGVLTYSRGRKTLVHFQLEDVQQKYQYIKGTFIRERGDKNSISRTSADMMVALAGLNAKAAATFELGERLFKLDFSSDYQLPSWAQKEQAKIAFKVQNLSSGKMHKLVNFGVIKLSQYPKYQIRYSQNVLYASGEQFEHDLKLGWAADDDEQVRLYTSVKKTGQRGKIDIESQSIAVYRPQNINYEVRATAALVGFGINGQKRYNIVINGNSRDQADSASAFQSEFSYSHINKSPLKMKMRATLKSRDIDFIYSDEIEERSPAKYHGHLLIQLNPEQKYDITYVYGIKAERGQNEHELNIELKNANTQKTMRHQGLLRMESSRVWLVRSKLNSDEDGEIFDGELNLAPGKTQFYFNHLPKEIRAKAEVDTNVSPANGHFELFTPLLKHESNFEAIPEQSWSFNSKTKRNGENLFEVEGKHDQVNRHQRLAISSKPFETEWQLDTPQDREQKVLARFEMPASWSHQSSLSRHPAKPYYTVDSHTKYAADSIADLSAKYDPESEHFLKFKSPLSRVELNAEMNQAKKQLRKGQLNIEAGKYMHLSKFAVEPRDDSFDFESTTQKSGQPLANLHYQWANDVHNIQVESPQFVKATAEGNFAPSSPKPYASIDVKLTDRQGKQYHHQTKVTAERDGSRSQRWISPKWISLESNTLKQDKNWAAIEATLNSQEKSFAKIRLGETLESKIELEPYKSARIKVDSPDYDHLTEMTYQPSEEGRGDWQVKSSTVSRKNQRHHYAIDAEHLRSKRSALKIDVPSFNSDLSYEHPEADLRNHQMNFKFNSGSTSASPLTHATMMRLMNAQQPIIQLESQTTRKNRRSGEEENIFNVDATYHHNEPKKSSSMKVKIGKAISGEIETSLYHPELKTIMMNGQYADDRSGFYRHQSEARFMPREGRFTVDTNTDRNGESLFKLNSIVSSNPEEKSWINLKAGRQNAYQLQAELERRNRRALLDFDFAPYEHRTEFTKEGGYKVKSLTTRDQENVFDLDGLWSPASEQSHLKIKAGPGAQYHSEILLHPGNKFGQINLRTKNLKHESTFKIDQDQTSGQSAHFKTNTMYEDALLADVDARLRGLRGENKIDAELPKFTFKTVVDVPSNKGSFDLKHRQSGRHLLGSVAVNSQVDADRSFHFDFAWDIDRNPASNVQFDLIVKRVPSQRSTFLEVVAISAQYAENKLVFNSELVLEQVWRNPIRVSLAFVPLDQARIGESWQLVYTHTMDDQAQFQCKWDFIVGEQLKYGLQLNGMMAEQKVQFGAKTIAPRHPQLQATFNFVAGSRTPGQQYYLDATAVHAETDRYQVIFDVTKHLETRKLDGKLEIRLPKLEVHIASFTLDLVHRQFKLDVVNEKTGKQVDVEASYADNLVHLKALSNIAFFPKVDAIVRYIPGEELHAKLDLDQERKFEITSKYTGELSTLQFYALTKVDSVYTPSVEFIAEGRKSPEDGNTERMVAITGKYNMMEVLNGQFRQQDVQQWTAEGSVASVHTGEKIVESSIQSTPVDGHSNAYQIKMIPRENRHVRPFVARIEEHRPSAANGYIRSIKIELVSEPAQKKILSTEVSIKHQKWAEVPAMFEVTLQHVPSASHGSIRVSIHEDVQEALEQSLFDSTEQTTGISQKRATRKVRDQAVIGWNQKSVGFSLTTVQYGAGSQAAEHDLKVYTPTGTGRVFQIRCAHQVTRELFFLKQQLRTDLTRQRDPVYQYTVIAQNDQQAGYTGKVQLESYKFIRSPKVVEFAFQPWTESKPLDAKLRIDVGQTEKDALTLKTVVKRQQSQNQIGGYFGTVSQNNTLHFSAKTQDRSVLDFEVDAHVSESSIGLLWKNLNRRGHHQQGHYLVRFYGEDASSYEAIFANPGHKYIVNGVYKRKAAQGPLVMDFVVSKLVSKHQSWSSKTAEPVLVAEHKVHVESAGKCIRADIENTQSQDDTTRQVNICADLNRANIVNIAIDSIRGGQKSAEFSARIDSRSVAQTLQLSLRWNPEYSRKLLASLLQLSQQNQQTLNEQLSNHELTQELIHKWSVIGQKLAQDFAYEPLSKIVAEEMLPIAEELGLNLEVISRWVDAAWEPVDRVLDVTRQYLSENVAQWDRAYQEYSAQWQRTCSRSKTCTKLSELIYAIQHSDDLSRLIAEPLVVLLQKSHRFVARSQGKLIQKLPAIDWEQFVPEVVQDFVQSTFETVYTWAARALIDTRNPFAGIIHHLETIVAELFSSAQFRQVHWERVSSAVEEALKLLFSPSSWTSSVRVLIWDPTTGQLQAEIKSPQMATVQQLNDTSSAPSQSGSYYAPYGSRWSNGINTYDRYANQAKRYFH